MPEKSCYTMPKESYNVMLEGYNTKTIEQEITKQFEFANHLREEFNFVNFQHVNALLNESKKFAIMIDDINE
ncbi:22215_t:CDS:1, partial [Gigaspora rosea]